MKPAIVGVHPNDLTQIVDALGLRDLCTGRDLLALRPRIVRTEKFRMPKREAIAAYRSRRWVMGQKLTHHPQMLPLDLSSLGVRPSVWRRLCLHHLRRAWRNLVGWGYRGQQHQ